MDISLGLLAGNVGHFFIHNMFFFRYAPGDFLF